MSASKTKRDRSPESSDLDDPSTITSKRRKSQSISSDISGSGDVFLRRPQPPPSANDLDRINYHIELQEFASSLQNAANLIFPGDQISRYAEVDVIILSWKDEDPHLPVSLEIEELSKTLAGVYNYNVEEWLIPADDSHNKLQTKVLQFLGDSDPRHLKIVYYAGHGKLTNHGQPAWTSCRNSGRERCPTVKWSGIQNSLEESRSDVLILLDCCASGVCTSDEGNGVTELMAACAYNSIANGVGPFSFTHALNMKLRQLAQLPSFTVGHLYNAIFTEVQNWRPEDSRHKKAPIHLVLSQSHDHPRSIRLSNRSKGKQPIANRQHSFDSQYHSFSASESQMAESQTAPSTQTSASVASGPESTGPFAQNSSPSSTATSVSQLGEYPRLLFSIRISEDIKPSELSTELFTDWLRDVPMSSSLVKVEAAFASDSTLLMASMPAAMLAYIPPNPSITFLGITRSGNILPSPVPESRYPENDQRTAPNESEAELEASTLTIAPANPPPDPPQWSDKDNLIHIADKAKELDGFNFPQNRGANQSPTPPEASGKLNSPPSSPRSSSSISFEELNGHVTADSSWSPIHEHPAVTSYLSPWPTLESEESLQFSFASNEATVAEDSKEPRSKNDPAT